MHFFHYLSAMNLLEGGSVLDQTGDSIGNGMLKAESWEILNCFV